MSVDAIKLSSVNYRNKQFKLEDISFHVPKGYVTGFIGSNGAGKTTIIRLMMNLLERDSGNITMLEREMPKFERAIKERIGFIYSELFINEKWTVSKIEKFIAPTYQQWDSELFHRYIEKFKLPTKKKIKTFSTGMKMKLSFAIAFSHHAELFILDEPTAGLDPVTRNEVLEIIQKELIDENITVFLSTHIISDIEQIADHIVYIKDGNILFDETKDALLDRYQMVQGNAKDLDEELKRYIINLKIKQTGFEGLTTEANAFRELFGNQVVISKPSIETLMVNLEQGGYHGEVLGVQS